jgi:hypothetical protein
MAKARKDHTRKEGVPAAAALIDATSSPPQSNHLHTQTQLSLVKATNLSTRYTSQSQKLLRIRSCMQTVAALMETNHVYLPIFLRLEEELKKELLEQDAIARARKYLSSSS